MVLYSSSIDAIRMQPLLFYKISISYHIFRGKKRGFEKNYKINFLPYSLPWKEEVGGKAARRGFPLLGSTINLFSKIFLPGTRHSPNSLTRIIFTWHTAQERPPKKSPDNFCSPFFKNASEKFDFRPNRNFSDGNFRKGVQKQTGFDFFLCRVPGVFCSFYVFHPSPKAPAKK